jgi:cytochrome b561
LAGRFLETPQVLPATAAGAWVWGVALLGLVPLWLARTAPPAQQVNARLGHVVLRLLFTAGGLVGLLLLMPENDRMRIGLVGLVWYGLTWVIDFGLLRQSAAQPTS